MFVFTPAEEAAGAKVSQWQIGGPAVDNSRGGSVRRSRRYFIVRNIRGPGRILPTSAESFSKNAKRRSSGGLGSMHLLRPECPSFSAPARRSGK